MILASTCALRDCWPESLLLYSHIHSQRITSVCAFLVVPTQVVYNMGPVPGFKWDEFDTVRERVRKEWACLPLKADNLSASLKAKITKQMELRGKVPAAAPA
jgi:hypothetical protein